ncbi:hypothetical protein EDD16DRAFT_1705319 [Pisolithus croceorrhizus]|nr:hypothetical protein EDD16DRAFT_1705319 [Pisolithus croceorrhizus]
MSYSALRNGNRPIPAFPNSGGFQTYPITHPIVPNTLPHVPSQPSKPIPSLPATGSFKAPAHKHAHHLHSIPPREKSTRTLIIDHMLWVHARTRFAQARAELGMTDRTGGPSSFNYAYRERPEQYEEDDEVVSDGEDASTLEAREGGTRHDDEEERRQRQDLVLAASLRLRSIGLEKVVTSMLEQPPPVQHPVLDDDLLTPTNSPKRGSKSHPHTLPNGVRLRLSLGTVINDLFSRQPPISPYRHHHHPPPIIVSTNSDQGSSESISPSTSPVPRNASPNPSIGASVISSSCSSKPTGKLPPSLALLSSVSLPVSKRPYSQLPTSQSLLTMPLHQNVITLTSRARNMYMGGADHSTVNSSPGLRCSRHLHAGCEICVVAKQSSKAPGVTGRGRAISMVGGSTNFGSKLAVQAPHMNFGKSMWGSNGGVTGWQDGSGIGTGLAQPGIHGSVLRRKSKWSIAESDTDHAGNTSLSAGNPRLWELIPRFLRLSALVSVELGRELGEEAFNAPEGEHGQGRTADETSMPTPTSPSPSPSRRPRSEAEVPPLQPSRDWYMLLAGLLTRAALEGYLTAGWRGADATECLLSVGRGTNDSVEISEDEDLGDPEFEWFDPDDLPGLKEATRILFPSLRGVSNSMTFRRDNAEAAFHMEMEARCRRFFDIPQQTPDLVTHMEDLAWHYPAEPVERAALRFCEAVAKWRGKPELESYKKNPKEQASQGAGNMTMESFVHSNPTSPTTTSFATQHGVLKSPRRPPIEKYFIVPQSITGSWNKRKRSFDDGERFLKRVH